MIIKYFLLKYGLIWYNPCIMRGYIMEKQTNFNFDENDDFTRKLLEANQRQLEQLQQKHEDLRKKELSKSSRKSIKNLFRRI